MPILSGKGPAFHRGNSGERASVQCRCLAARYNRLLSEGPKERATGEGGMGEKLFHLR